MTTLLGVYYNPTFRARALHIPRANLHIQDSPALEPLKPLPQRILHILLGEVRDKIPGGWMVHECHPSERLPPACAELGRDARPRWALLLQTSGVEREFEGDLGEWQVRRGYQHARHPPQYVRVEARDLEAERREQLHLREGAAERVQVD